MLVSAGTLLAAIGHGPAGHLGRRAVLPDQFDAGDQRLLPADRHSSSAEGSLGGRSRGHGRPSATTTRRLSRSASLFRPRWQSWSRQLHRLRAASGRFAAASRLRRQVHHVERDVPVRRHERRCHHLDAAGGPILSGLAVMIALMRAGIRVFWVPIDQHGADGTLPRDAADRGLAVPLRRTHGQGRPGDTLHAGHGNQPSRPQAYVKDVLSAPRVQKPQEGGS